MKPKRRRPPSSTEHSLDKRTRRVLSSPTSKPVADRLGSLRSSQSRAIHSPEAVYEDDICPICQQLLCRPVATICNHHLCETCMVQWAEISTSSQMTILDVNEQIVLPVSSDALDLEVNCPMCRTQTSATRDHRRERLLSQYYPNTYALRRAEDEAEAEAVGQGTGSCVQILSIYIGNRHNIVASGSDEKVEDLHQCVFFVKPSGTDIIEEVQIQLPSQFKPSRIIRSRPPFEIERTTQNTFTVCAYIILKAGYSWLSSDAADSPDGATKGLLPLEWTLDFTGNEGRGSMGRIRLKVMREGAGTDDGQNHEQEDRELRRDRNAWERMVRDYQRDGLWNPNDSDDE